MFEKGNLYRSLDLIEDMMQEVPEIIRGCFFRGIPEEITEDRLLKYLLGTVKNSTRKNLYKNFEKEAMNSSLEQSEEEGEMFPDTSQNEELEETRDLKREIITYFISCLMETNEKPYKAVTYSYASLLPMIFKGTQNEAVLKKMVEMSARRGNEKSGGYIWKERKERFELTGEISRNSDNLLKWAIDAMWDRTTDFLQQEVSEIYNMEPIGDAEFRWGKAFCKALEEDYDEKRKIRDIVIASEFTTLGMKNWPTRLENSLYRRTREHFMNETYYDFVASQYQRKHA
jgi:hypothetical protein